MKQMTYLLLSSLLVFSCAEAPKASEKNTEKTVDKTTVKENACNGFRKTAAPKKFEEFDANKDKSVSRAEYNCLTMKRFTELDKDGDLFLSKAELKKAGNWKVTGDQNGDGKISMIEYSFLADVAFSAVDSNKDGSIAGNENGEALP